VKTDSIFYRLFQEFPSIFFELIDNPQQTADAYKFSSVEVKQTAFRIDGVFVPNRVTKKPIYFIEVQFQSDTELYSRLISEINLYLRYEKPENPWRAIVIYPTRSLDSNNIYHYEEYFQSQRVRRIYLDELGDAASLPVGIATIKLVIENEDVAITTARELIERTEQGVNTGLPQKQLLELIETILVYKFPTMSRKEIEDMFGLSDLQKTRVYQEAKQEGEQTGERMGSIKAKTEAVPRLFALNLTVEQISQALDLDIEQVRQIVQKIQNQ
jgi:predicted transposase/invertase (TIGR01784 family)